MRLLRSATSCIVLSHVLSLSGVILRCGRERSVRSSSALCEVSHFLSLSCSYTSIPSLFPAVTRSWKAGSWCGGMLSFSSSAEGLRGVSGKCCIALLRRSSCCSLCFFFFSSDMPDRACFISIQGIHSAAKVRTQIQKTRSIMAAGDESAEVDEGADATWWRRWWAGSH